jgi:hypothetical protein
MRDRHDREIRDPVRARLHPSEGKELIGAQHDRGDTAPFQLRGVVDTPRRARASVGRRGQRHLAGCGDLVEERRRGTV